MEPFAMNSLLRLRLFAIILCLAAVTASGCGGDSTSAHAAVTDGQLCQFHLGTTSIEDVTKLLGVPTRSGTTGPFYYLLYDYPGSDGASIDLILSFQGGYLMQVSRKDGTAPQVNGLPSSCNGASALGATS
jgi:hypothetical protein